MRAAAATRVDDISMRIMQKYFKTKAPVLIKIFYVSISPSYFPAARRVARVLALNKLGNYDYTTVRAYRLIILLFHLGKILEIVANHQLRTFMERIRNFRRFKQGSNKDIMLKVLVGDQQRRWLPLFAARDRFKMFLWILRLLITRSGIAGCFKNFGIKQLHSICFFGLNSLYKKRNVDWWLVKPRRSAHLSVGYPKAPRYYRQYS